MSVSIGKDKQEVTDMNTQLKYTHNHIHRNHQLCSVASTICPTFSYHNSICPRMTAPKQQLPLLSPAAFCCWATVNVTSLLKQSCLMQSRASSSWCQLLSSVRLLSFARPHILSPLSSTSALMLELQSKDRVRQAQWSVFHTNVVQLENLCLCPIYVCDISIETT